MEIARLFSEGKSPKRIVKSLKEEYPSLSKARISREFVKKAIKLVTAVLLPEMVRLVPDNGNWSLMIDGTVRAKYDDVLIIIAAVPLGEASEYSPTIIPLMARFVPSENTHDILQLLYELKPRLPSQPKSIISDFRAGLLEAVGEVFPNSVKQGCHYHMIEMIARILIHPLINQILRQIRGAINGINRWAHHSIYGEQSEKLMLVARSLRKLCIKNHGKFGENFLQFCKKFQELSSWINENRNLIKSDQRYQELVKLIDHKLWRQLSPQLSQLEFVLKEFNRLRRCLTTQEYKTQVDSVVENSKSSVLEFDNLIQDWIKIGKIKKESVFHKRFRRSVTKLRTHYQLLIPAIEDHKLPRTTSVLENLYGQIKSFLRKWSGSMTVRQSFSWAASLAAISQSLKETGQFGKILEDQTSYDWIEKTLHLAKISSQYHFQTHFANEVANKIPSGLVSTLANLIIRDIET